MYFTICYINCNHHFKSRIPEKLKLYSISPRVLFFTKLYLSEQVTRITKLSPFRDLENYIRVDEVNRSL